MFFFSGEGNFLWTIIKTKQLKKNWQPKKQFGSFVDISSFPISISFFESFKIAWFSTIHFFPLKNTRCVDFLQQQKFSTYFFVSEIHTIHLTSDNWKLCRWDELKWKGPLKRVRLCSTGINIHAKMHSNELLSGIYLIPRFRKNTLEA